MYEDSQMVTLTAPYVAGFLAFRETPSLLDCLRRLEKKRPDLLPQVPPTSRPWERRVWGLWSEGQG